ncbi:hypothetical protein ACFRCG_41385 [Embleya sp. NPDC056575]
MILSHGYDGMPTGDPAIRRRPDPEDATTGRADAVYARRQQLP